MTDMTDNQQKFKELYINDIINGSGEMGEELLKLFDVVLAEFDDDPEKMSTFIQSIIDEHTPPEPTEVELLQQENLKLRQRLEMTEGAVIEIARMVIQ